MRKMKKALATVLAATMVMGMSSTAWAAVDPNAGKTDNFVNEDKVTVTKNFKLENAETISPNATFTLEQVGDGVVTDGDATSAPPLGEIIGTTFTEGTATVDGTQQDITITLPTYTRVGIYEYTLKEVVPDNCLAGVDYFGNDIKLIVSVIQQDGLLRVAAVHTEGTVNGTKSDVFTNIYKAGSLAVSKNVEGNMGDKSKEFDVMVTFTAPTNKTVSAPISYIEDGKTKTISVADMSDGNQSVTIKLKDAETITFTNIPYDVTYNVEETDDAVKILDGATKSEYSVTYDDNKEGTISSASVQTIILNTKGANIDTGINLDSLPYIMILAVAALGMVGFVAKKRKEEEMF